MTFLFCSPRTACFFSLSNFSSVDPSHFYNVCLLWGNVNIWEMRCARHEPRLGDCVCFLLMMDLPFMGRPGWSFSRRSPWQKNCMPAPTHTALYDILKPIKFITEQFAVVSRWPCLLCAAWLKKVRHPNSDRYAIIKCPQYSLTFYGLNAAWFFITVPSIHSTPLDECTFFRPGLLWMSAWVSLETNLLLLVMLPPPPESRTQIWIFAGVRRAVKNGHFCVCYWINQSINRSICLVMIFGRFCAGL